MDKGNKGPRRFHLTSKILVGIVIIVVVVVGVFVYVYYSMSVDSVSSITIDEVLADRNFVSGTYPNRNATFIIEVQVWTKAQALSVRLENPIFSVELPGISLGNETKASATILPGACLTYNFRFNINESRNVDTISFPNSTVVVEVRTSATAGFYTSTITAGDNALWDWTTATLLKDYG